MREYGAVLSMRGGDFVVSLGGDLSVGSRMHDRPGDPSLLCRDGRRRKR
jgi:hypothetical protein